MSLSTSWRTGRNSRPVADYIALDNPGAAGVSAAMAFVGVFAIFAAGRGRNHVVGVCSPAEYNPTEPVRQLAVFVASKYRGGHVSTAALDISRYSF